MKAFEDYSIFQSIQQYFDESGQEWRIVEDKSGGFCSLYKSVHGAFWHQGCSKKPQGSLKKIHEQLTK